LITVCVDKMKMSEGNFLFILFDLSLNCFCNNYGQFNLELNSREKKVNWIWDQSKLGDIYLRWFWNESLGIRKLIKMTFYIEGYFRNCVLAWLIGGQFDRIGLAGAYSGGFWESNPSTPSFLEKISIC